MILCFRICCSLFLSDRPDISVMLQTFHCSSFVSLLFLYQTWYPGMEDRLRTEAELKEDGVTFDEEWELNQRPGHWRNLRRPGTRWISLVTKRPEENWTPQRNINWISAGTTKPPLCTGLSKCFPHQKGWRDSTKCNQIVIGHHWFRVSASEISRSSLGGWRLYCVFLLNKNCPALRQDDSRFEVWQGFTKFGRS